MWVRPSVYVCVCWQCDSGETRVGKRRRKTLTERRTVCAARATRPFSSLNRARASERWPAGKRSFTEPSWRSSGVVYSAIRLPHVRCSFAHIPILYFTTCRLRLATCTSFNCDDKYTNAQKFKSLSNELFSFLFNHWFPNYNSRCNFFSDAVNFFIKLLFKFRLFLQSFKRPSCIYVIACTCVRWSWQNELLLFYRFVIHHGISM